jgi:branched-subunit amino acid transport protein
LFRVVQLLAMGLGAGAVGVGGHDCRLHLQQIPWGAHMMVWAVIIGMGVLVFLNRYVFLEPRLPLRLSSNARQFLGFAVPGMLTAICGPIVFMPDKQLNLQWDNPYLISSLVAVGLVLYTRNTLLSMLLSMGFFFLLRWWL